MNIEPLTSDDPAEVARYRLHARLGSGGMGRVYLAFTPGGRPVALKMVRPELGDDRDFRHRFQQEIDAARRVHGLYTAQVLDADPAATPPWLVTAYVPGPSLQEAVSRHGPMPAHTVLGLMAGVAEALQVIHAAGVVHRDLKPSNVLLAPDGPRVIDFGISRAAETTPLTHSGIRIGSPHYMAPEQVANLPVSAAADVFALGALTAYAVLGRSSFGEGNAIAVMYRVLHEPADLGGCPSPLREIIERCLAKDAAERPAPAEIISWCRALTTGSTWQIAQPWLPPPAEATIAATRPAREPRAASAPSAISADRDPAVGGRRKARTAILAICAVVLLATAVGARLVAALSSLADPAASSGTQGTGSPPAAASPPRSWLTGTWTGPVDQPTGMVTQWTAQLSFPEAGRVGTFRFPSLGCSGNLIVTSATHSTAAVYEDLTHNPRKLCASGGLMKLTRSGANGMDMTWQDSSDRHNVATAHLRSRD